MRYMGRYTHENNLILSAGQEPSVSLTHITPVDILNGEVICPIYAVEFTCIGIKLGSLGWQRNGLNIGGTFSAGISNEGDIQQVGPLTLLLDSITTLNSVANMTSRLVANISNLSSGDTITCAGSMSTADTVTLSYSSRGNYDDSYIH